MCTRLTIEQDRKWLIALQEERHREKGRSFSIHHHFKSDGTNTDNTISDSCRGDCMVQHADPIWNGFLSSEWFIISWHCLNPSNLFPQTTELNYETTQQIPAGRNETPFASVILFYVTCTLNMFASRIMKGFQPVKLARSFSFYSSNHSTLTVCPWI